MQYTVAQRLVIHMLNKRKTTNRSEHTDLCTDFLQFAVSVELTIPHT